MSGRDRSEQAFLRAQRVLVGGVNSPVRAYAAVGDRPVFLASGRGAKVVDLDENEYVDYVGSWGPMILGHAHPRVIEAVREAAGRGLSFGAPSEAETALAERIVAALGSAQKVRFTSSGTEAAMTAVRLARGATGRNRIVKFLGGYHGHSDALLVQAGSGAATLGTPSSPGIPPGATQDTLLLPYNDISAVERVFADQGPQIAAVLLEPVAGNMGVVPPAEGFLPALRAACSRAGAMLIFDEVMTGFRIAWGGAQRRYAVEPDLTVLGKIIGGGLPVGALAGPEAIMDHLAPAGAVYQAGTLSGNPMAMAAGLATLELLASPGVYDELEATAAALEAGLRQGASEAGLAAKVCFQRVGSMFCCFFTPGPVTDDASARASDSQAFAAFFHAMLERGVYLPPSQYEAWFLSTAHTAADVEATCQAGRDAFFAAAEVMKTGSLGR